MALSNTPVLDNPQDYPLTVVAVDGLGDECYRTQLDWNGSSRDLSEVPSADLNNRRPRWVSLEVVDAHGKVVYSGTNPDTGDGESDRDLLEQKYGDHVHGTEKADALASTGGRDGDAGDLQAADPKKDVKESAKNTDEHTADEKPAGKVESKSAAKSDDKKSATSK